MSTLGPLLLWYDNRYLGMNRRHLDAAGHNLVHFPQHDRITMAGTMVAIGVLYAGLAWGGIRRGWGWARKAYLISGGVGFPTRRALAGRLIMIITGLGLFAGGAVVSVVGLTTVFVPTDLTFLGTDTDYLHAVNPRLVPFIAHDRAGFGPAVPASRQRRMMS